MKKSVKMWIKALRSGKYNQGKNMLFDQSKNSYCCLGVACDLYNKTHKKKVDLTSEILETESLDEDKWVVRKWLGLKHGLGTSVTAADAFSLADMNDKGSSFEEIAKVIETTPSLFN